MKLPDRGLVVGVVHLVGDQQHRASQRRAAASATRASSSVDPDGGVDHEQHDVGLARWPVRLCRLTFSSRSSPPGIHRRCRRAMNGAALPLGLDLLAVAGDARALLDDRLAAPDDAVHQRRLADVGPADDGDDREVAVRLVGPGRCRRAAPRSATPSVATISTGRGRSSGAVPSRNRPCGQADVGQQVAMPLGLGRPAPGRGPRPPSAR